MANRYDELTRSFRWDVPARLNIARACCGRWAADRNRFALYWEDESGASAAYSFWVLQMWSKDRQRLETVSKKKRDFSLMEKCFFLTYFLIGAH